MTLHNYSGHQYQMPVFTQTSHDNSQRPHQITCSSKSSLSCFCFSKWGILKHQSKLTRKVQYRNLINYQPPTAATGSYINLDKILEPPINCLHFKNTFLQFIQRNADDTFWNVPLYFFAEKSLIPDTGKQV